MTKEKGRVLPAYNRAGCIGKAIASANAQEGINPETDIEIIIMDDASTDDTADVLRKIKAGMPNLRVYRHHRNLGVSAARNSGISVAKGDFIAFLDSDDVWHKSKTLIQLTELMQRGRYDLLSVFSLTYFKNQQGERRSINNVFLDKKINGRASWEPRIYTPQEIERGILTWELFFGCGSTLLAHRGAIIRNGDFREDIGYGEDTEYLVRHLVSGGKVSVVPEFLMTYDQPEDGKVYPGGDAFHQYMLKTYRCAIAQKFGDKTAREFVKRIRENAHLSNSVHQKWKVGRKLVVPVDAPCRRDPSACGLRGTSCRYSIGSKM